VNMGFFERIRCCCRMIFVSIFGRSTPDVLLGMRRAAGMADAVELRLDMSGRIDVPAIVAAKPGRLIVTCRPARAGGDFKGGEAERLGLLADASAAGADLVDVELDSAARYIACAKKKHGRRSPGWSPAGKMIVSHHDSSGTPDDLPAAWRRAAAFRPAFVKICPRANRVEDNLRIQELLARTDLPTIAFCTGSEGVISRILYRRFGSAGVFASLDKGQETGEGQIDAGDLRGLYRAHELGRKTAVFALVGNPVAHSSGPQMFNGEFARLGLDAVYIPLKLGSLDSLPAIVRGFGIRGFSVTIPFKERIVKRLDRLDGAAWAIDAVNTVLIRSGGRLVGFNFDCEAATGAIRSEFGDRRDADRFLEGANALILGSGGAARAIAYGLRRAGAMLMVTSRNPAQGKKIVRDFGGFFIDWADRAEALDGATILVNTTPVGMHPKKDEMPVPAERLRKGMLVFDTVYNPVRTRLIQEAARRGCRVVSGLEMFLRQAMAQLELFRQAM
jgi:3-dehydroquinate dehydratase/shikimate dehydrogenase